MQTCDGVLCVEGAILDAQAHRESMACQIFQTLKLTISSFFIYLEKFVLILLCLVLASVSSMPSFFDISFQALLFLMPLCSQWNSYHKLPGTFGCSSSMFHCQFLDLVDLLP